MHNNSLRKTNKFVSINLKSLSGTLIESELFGHEKNAFNNADERKGLLEEANNGTLFLDEIHNTPISDQLKLLTIFNKKEIVIRRVGGNKDIPINVRIIWGTNKDLSKEVMNGNFHYEFKNRIDSRSDTIFISPLNERRNEISTRRHDNSPFRDNT